MESSNNISATSKNRHQQLNLLIFTIIVLASFIAFLAGIPYVSDLLKLPIPSLGEVLIGSLLQTLINIPVILLGLHLGAKVGLGTRDLRALLAREPKALQNFLKSARYAFIIGLITGAVLLLLSRLSSFILPPDVANIARDIKSPQAIAGFLGSISAGINEEIIMRLFIMSFFIWLFTKILRRPQPNNGMIWAANIIAALLFGALHLPLTAQIYKELIPIIVLNIIILNTLAGTLFGWLYWKRGILAAVIAHFVADIVLHVIPAFFVK
ncbi:abortive infection protein [Dulcicalothrix desertica PCC 7102]|uniref:Abortive infection protein n=1 Tax=Dulcicalothrix desertica PCC 7102 TaxID=232991 RepID=A0A3S1ABE0_9CYAN|nr:CPBP family intramembrane glutamic endopeptidase [Dulcicalothrix desertica]RUS97633.1 abortive infection protein [Dulcicalothrix desertica PCC 7102]TWH54842.1 CAAX prenyl protease-like protein [Dulcicalothrix desertica PCC 7102]